MNDGVDARPRRQGKAESIDERGLVSALLILSNCAAAKEVVAPLRGMCYRRGSLVLHDQSTSIILP